MMPLSFGRQLCGDLDSASQREWLVTDGVGGYAMGTVGGLRTRRYHGMLIVAEAESLGRRHLGLASLNVVIGIGDRRVRLATHEWSGGAIDPAGYRHLASFTLHAGVPTWRWSVDGVVLEMAIAAPHGRSGIGVSYHLVASPSPVRLEIEALCTWRDIHGERYGGTSPEVDQAPDGFVFEESYRVQGPGFRPSGSWYRGVHYREEANRGLNASEDLWLAGSFSAELSPGERTGVRAWAGNLGDPPPDPADMVTAARLRARRLAQLCQPDDTIDETLAIACDQFITTDATTGNARVVAGYPWFGDWSRDTMIAYEGLFLETRRSAEGRSLLVDAAGSLSEGMLSNTGDTGVVEFNTADATLWFIHALGRHVALTGDLDLAAELAADLDTIVEHHRNGTRYGISVDPNDGLLTQGAPGIALSWMDARIDGTPVTPRTGKAVEINALWINALATISELSKKRGATSNTAARLEARARASFRRFILTDGSLMDVIDGPAGDDPTVRPNQLLAASLPNGPYVNPSVVTACIPLLTSIGLRSLTPGDPAFQGHHRGGPAERDLAYHQGTVWPWLLGPYVEASLKVGAQPAPFLRDIDTHLGEYGLGSISETTDGAIPHRASGCPFQAWSVAEVFRARRLVRRVS